MLPGSLHGADRTWILHRTSKQPSQDEREAYADKYQSAFHRNLVAVFGEAAAAVEALTARDQLSL